MPCRRSSLERLDAIRSLSRISALLENQMLMTAFQPIYGLASKSVVGVEALSRFVSDDGAGAELWFAEAAAVGLGANLEFSALGSAADAAANLPPHLYVSLNISPTSCLDPRLPELFDHIDLPVNRIVLELTEVIPDDEYPHFISAITPLRERGLRIAIDDSYSGAGALSRMVHLRPDFIKLGRDVISGVDVDPTQQALAACMVDFAEQIGTDAGCRRRGNARGAPGPDGSGHQRRPGLPAGPAVRAARGMGGLEHGKGSGRHHPAPLRSGAERGPGRGRQSPQALTPWCRACRNMVSASSTPLLAVPLVPAHLVFRRRGLPRRHSPARFQAGDVSLERIRVGRIR